LLPVAVGVSVLVPASAVSAVAAESPEVIRFDGGGFDEVFDVAVDAAGNTYLAGQSQAPNTNFTFAVVKLDAQGAVVWRYVYSGSQGGDMTGTALAVAVDRAGNVYAAGGTGGAFGGEAIDDLLLVKLNSDGVEQWATRFDTQRSSFATEIAIDPTGAVYVSGGIFDLSGDWLTQRYSPNGALQWSRTHSGVGFSSSDRVKGIAVAPNGNLVVAGTTRHQDDLTTADIDVLTYDQQGTVVWQRRFTETDISDDEANDVDVDSAGRITVTGTTSPVADFQKEFSTPLTMQFDASGALLRTIRAGGAAVDVDGAGNAYLAGAFRNAPEASAVAKFDAAGAQVWRTPLTLPDPEVLRNGAIAIDSTGGVVVTGTVRAVDLSAPSEYLTIRYAADGRELWRHRLPGPADGSNQVGGLGIDGQDTAVVAGTTASNGAFDMLTLRFPAGVTPVGIPEPPDLVTATAQQGRQVRLTWRDNATTEAGFRIERCRGLDCHNFVQIAVVGPNVTTFLDSGLTNRVTYTYRIRAFNANGTSRYSNTAVATARTR
jgi:hypothetical protein